MCTIWLPSRSGLHQLWRVSLSQAYTAAPNSPAATHHSSCVPEKAHKTQTQTENTDTDTETDRSESAAHFVLSSQSRSPLHNKPHSVHAAAMRIITVHRACTNNHTHVHHTCMGDARHDVIPSCTSLVEHGFAPLLSSLSLSDAFFLVVSVAVGVMCGLVSTRQRCMCTRLVPLQPWR